MRGAVAVGLVCVLFLTVPARSDAGWAGMLVQMVSVLENLRRIVQTAEEMTANATGRVPGPAGPRRGREWNPEPV